VTLRILKAASAGIALVLLNTAISGAQATPRGTWDFRAVGGLGRSSISDSDFNEISNFKLTSAWTLGVEIARQIGQPRLSLSAGLSRTNRGTRLTVPPGDPNAGAANLQTDYLELPILLHAAIGQLGPARFQALGGAVFSSNGAGTLRRASDDLEIASLSMEQIESSAAIGIEVLPKRRVPISLRFQYQRAITATVADSPKSRSNMFMLSGVWAIKRW
jgi:hypothetical protein